MQALVISVILLWVLVLILLVLVVLLYRQFGLLYLGSGQRVRMTGRAVGKHAVEGLTVELEGTEVELDWSQPGEGRGTLLVLGGPVCPLCAELVPQLNDVVEEWGSRVDVLFVDRRLPGLRNTERELPGVRSWAYAMSPDGAVHDAFDAEVSPFAFLVDHGGIVLAKELVNSSFDLGMIVQRSMDQDGNLALHVSPGVHVELAQQSAQENTNN